MATANSNEVTTARSIGTLTIQFGLVAVPCKVYTTEQKGDEIHFNMLHDADKARLKQHYKCTGCDQVVDADHTVKGYEHAKGQYVIFTSDELKAIDAVATNAVELDGYVRSEDIDLMLVEKSYYLGPDKGCEKVYELFLHAMARRNAVGVGRWAARGKEHLVAIRPFEDGGTFGLAMHQLRYAREIKPWSAVPVRAAVTLSAAEIKAAEQLIAASELAEIDLASYEDRVRQRTKQLIETKIAGGEIVAAPAETPAAPIDLMQALKASLADAPKKPKATPIKKGKKPAAKKRPAA